MVEKADMISRPGTIISNIKFNAISQIAAFLINLALLPFIVAHTGNEIYGVYILVVTFTGYLGLLDLGVGGAAVKYIAEFASRGDEAKVREIISATMSFFAVMGLLAAAILFILSFCFNALFKVDPQHHAVIQQMFRVAAFFSLFIWPGRAFDHALQGYQRYDLFAINNIIFTALTGAFAYVIFMNGLGIVWYIAVGSLLIVMKYARAGMLVHRDLIKGRIRFPYFDRAVMTMIFDFSFFVFLSSLAGIIIFNVDAVIVGAFVSVAAVTLYNVGFNLQQGCRMINSLIGGPLFPAYAGMEGRSEYQQQKSLVLKGTQYMAAAFVPLVVIMVVFAGLFIRSWMGDGFEASVMPARILLAFWLFNGTVEIASGMLTAKGFVKEIFHILLLTALANLILSLVLVRPLGIAGVALGTTLPMVFIYFPLVIRQVCRVFNMTAGQYLRSSIKEALAGLVIAGALSMALIRVFPPQGFLPVVLEMAVVYGVTLGMLYGFIFSREDRAAVGRMMGIKA